MAAAWAGREIPDKLRGVTTSMSVNFLRPLQAEDLRIVADRLHNGKRLCHCTVDLLGATSGTLVRERRDLSDRLIGVHVSAVEAEPDLVHRGQPCTSLALATLAAGQLVAGQRDPGPSQRFRRERNRLGAHHLQRCPLGRQTVDEIECGRRGEV